MVGQGWFYGWEGEALRCRMVGKRRAFASDMSSRLAMYISERFFAHLKMQCASNERSHRHDALTLPSVCCSKHLEIDLAFDLDQEYISVVGNGWESMYTMNRAHTMGLCRTENSTSYKYHPDPVGRGNGTALGRSQNRPIFIATCSRAISPPPRPDPNPQRPTPSSRPLPTSSYTHHR